MTLEEIQNWIKSTKCIDYTDEFVDNCGNEERTKIYQKDNKLYAIDFFNSRPLETYIDNRGYVRGMYPEPREVQRKARIVEQVYYE